MCRNTLLGLTVIVICAAAVDTGSTQTISAELDTSASSCPQACFCNTLSHIVYCSRRGLDAIPAGIASSTVQLNLNGNAFQTATIERRNFTALTKLQHLYMSECAIERILIDTFVDLTSLQWLDLSNNRIKVRLTYEFSTHFHFVSF